MIFDFRTGTHDCLEPVTIKNEQVESVSTYKYLGVMIDEKLTWEPNTDLVCAKARKRLFFLRKLN